MKSSVRWLFRIVFVAAAVYLFSVLPSSPCSANPSAISTRAKIPAHTASPIKTCAFASRGGDAELAAWYCPTQATTPHFVLVHGKDGSRTHEQNRRNDEFMSALYRQPFYRASDGLARPRSVVAGAVQLGINESRDVLGGF